MITIRFARPDDVDAITRIYNEAVLNTTATFDMEPKTEDDRRAWLAHHDEKYCVLVVEKGREIAGYASLSRWSEKQAYDNTVQLSVYIDSLYRGNGLGRKLTEAIIRRAKETGIHCIVSLITADNSISVALHEKLGFRFMGTMKEAGVKFGTLLDVHFYQFLL